MSMAVGLWRLWLGRLAQMLNPEVGLQGLPVVYGVTQRGEESGLESTHRMRRIKKVPMQFHGINLRTVRIRKEHGRFYRRLSLALNAEA